MQELINDKAAGTYSYHSALKGQEKKYACETMLCTFNFWTTLPVSTKVFFYKRYAVPGLKVWYT
jgi:hypothetical protein